ncbi:MAG: HPr family phosphocarrier protein [Gammaproteobacteria bacterium]|nr:HPr family phosphocarrier protein [Gammaproteobacteria bacterium]MCH9745050.1 HPr family phosphocarrier protein [Gammaproteobacteria bacterium]
MISQKIKIRNKLGLHARAAMKLIDLAGRYQSHIDICFADKIADAKDILNVMTLGASIGSEIQLQVDGSDEKQAMKALCDLINDRFGEPE